jgi:hypothetical protein
VLPPSSGGPPVALPENPPFKVYISNIAYDLEADAAAHFFRGLTVRPAAAAAAACPAPTPPALLPRTLAPQNAERICPAMRVIHLAVYDECASAVLLCRCKTSW